MASAWDHPSQSTADRSRRFQRSIRVALGLAGALAVFYLAFTAWWIRKFLREDDYFAVAVAAVMILLIPIAVRYARSRYRTMRQWGGDEGKT